MEASRVSIDVAATPVLSYPMAHNGIPAVSRLTVSGVPVDVRAATLRLAVADALGPLADPLEILLDLEAGRTVVLTDLKLVLDPARMLQVEEQRPGTIRVTLQAGELTAEQVVRTRVLAAHQWLASPPALALELLAAHVQPNHPAVRVLLDDAAERLRAWTGSAAIQGYQAGPERVDGIAEAVFAAMQARGIRYAEPPASWADDGQKVRTPGEVLDERVGTCLDLVVVLAAALEQAGVRPLLWIADGHAFLGYWRVEASLGAVAELDPAGVMNLVDLDRIRLVETTAVTGSTAFTDARPDPALLAGGLDRVLGVVDVHRAREDRIVPLPARTRDADGTVHVSVYRPAASTPSTVDAPAAAARPVPGRAPEPPRVTRWKNALLDLSLRNRLLNFSARTALSVTVPPGGPAVLEDLLHAGAAITLRPSDDLAEVDRQRGLRHARELPPSQVDDLLRRRIAYVDVPAGGYPARMRALAYKARTIVEETGANNLYLCLGTLVWELDGRSLRSPLVLVPVTVRAASRGGDYRLTLDETGQSTPNYCLVEKLRQLHGLDVPGLADPATDETGIDLAAAFGAVREAILERGLAYRVDPTADLAVLQFAKFRLWKDLDENWAAFAGNPLVEHLIRTPTDAFADPVPAPLVQDLDGLDELCPVPADASQLRAIAEAVAGSTFVLEGPPGTGKSQTITNLLVRAVAEGKRVLFVAEKRAALDVVRRRLEAVGMDPLALDLHDKGSKPAAVRAQISRALEHTVVADTQAHEIRTEELRAARRTLTRYAYGLHERNPAGLSLYEARGAVLAYGEGAPVLPVPVDLPSASTVEGVRQLLGTLPEVAAAARPRPGHPWGFVDVPGVDAAALTAAAHRLDAAVGALPSSPGLAAARTPADLAVLAELLEAGLPLAVLDEVRTPRWAAAADGAVRRAAEFATASHAGLDLVTPAVLGLPVREIDAAARAAAASGFFGRRKRLRAVRDRLTPALRPNATVAPKHLPALTGALVALRVAADELAGSIAAIPGLRLPPGWDPFAGRAVLTDRVAAARRLGGLVAAAGPLRDAVAAPVDPRPVRAAADAAAELIAATGPTAGSDGNDLLAGWSGVDGLLARWRATAAERSRPGSLERWLDLLRHLEPLRTAHLDDARTGLLTGTVDPDEARPAFELGLALASVTERLRATGLDGFDRAAHERSIARFVGASRAVRDHLATVLPRQVLAARSFYPASAGGTVGALWRQLRRQRGGMKVRELMTTFGDVITAALPCVLVSPDSLARFFPAAQGLFDLVVFDEASQVRVADAIGAMGRARSVVVVGDSKQLPPTSYAESVVADDEHESDVDTVEDEESILTECVQARVRRHRLSWHYRSQDEALIAFSNVSYYDGGLATFPAPPMPGTGVSLVRVDGTFHRSGPRETFRTNPVEARAVVDEIVRRFAAAPDRPPSIGVVTFNLQQRTYIEGLLRDAGDQRLLDALEDPDGLFVKNLENVQGDERDVVLFSTAFSVNERGVLPLNFGPLNLYGGERRLNVAVTRARRQVVVYSSFDPAQLRTEETASVGLRHLRTYLEMAAHGPSVLPRDGQRRALPDRHREEIAARLRERGVEVRTAVGLSGFALDLVLGAEADPRVAVLLDGVPWSQRMTARDRDALPREVLVDVLHWPAVERVWLPDWLADPEAVLDRLVGAAGRERPATAPPERPAAEEEAGLRDLRDRPEPEPGPPVGPGRERGGPAGPTPEPGAPAGPGREAGGVVRPFVPWEPGPLGTVDVLDALPARAAARRVGAALAAAVTAEGPVPVERLARLVAAAFGLSRVSEARRAAILAQLPPELLVADGVVWPAGTAPAEWTAVRTGAERPLEQVPLPEIGNAMVAAARASAGMPADELRRAALASFGGRRLTPALTARLDEALAATVRAGRLAERGGVFVAT